MAKFLKLTQNQGVLHITLNRPDKRNAFNPEMIAEFRDVFSKIPDEKNLRAILLSGEGQSFCAGGDLDWMKSMVDATSAQNLADANELFAMYWSIRKCPVPLVGRVFGHAFGGGVGLVAVCDIVAAESETLFSFSEVKIGLAPAVISPFVCEKARAHKIREWFLTGAAFKASEALSGGLIHFHGSIAEVDSYIETTLNHIMQAGPEAVRATKALHQSFSLIDWDADRARVTSLIAERRVSQEGQEGLSSFLEKRKPAWSQIKYAAPAKNS